MGREGGESPRHLPRPAGLRGQPAAPGHSGCGARPRFCIDYIQSDAQLGSWGAASPGLLQQDPGLSRRTEAKVTLIALAWCWVMAPLAPASVPRSQRYSEPVQSRLEGLPRQKATEDAACGRGGGTGRTGLLWSLPCGPRQSPGHRPSVHRRRCWGWGPSPHRATQTHGFHITLSGICRKADSS